MGSTSETFLNYFLIMLTWSEPSKSMDYAKILKPVMEIFPSCSAIE